MLIDPAKNSFHVCGFRSDGVANFNWAVSRRRLVQFLADQRSCIAATETCAISHHGGRVAMGHYYAVRSIPAHYMKPFVKQQKSDFTNVAAITEAVSRPSMIF